MDFESFRSLVPRFADRTDAGKQLASALSHYRGKPDVIVLGLPRGGVVAAAAIAQRLDLPLDTLVVRKLCAPGHEELGIGAIGPDGVRVLNDDMLRVLHVTPERIDSEIREEVLEIDLRERLYRGNSAPRDLRGKTVILVDDGVATGATMEAAIAVIRNRHAARIVVAVPVAPIDTSERLRSEADELVCLEMPAPFFAVGYWYTNFTPVEDNEVVALLERARAPMVAA
ncbi:MAG TPA: phosphoribosyltransferase [Thermoanaerobaculia bacterium]